jgi:deazaflavin-dependent oxidoreductase (nitroreductase family)
MNNSSLKKPSERQERSFNFIVRAFSKLDGWMMKHTKLRLLARSAPALLLTTIGRKSGQPRTTPVLYLRAGTDIVVVASKGGMPNHPLWYLNLEANPNVEVEVAGQKTAMLARRATEEEKQRLWPRLVEMYPDFNTYQARTDRDIPVIFLSPK